MTRRAAGWLAAWCAAAAWASPADLRRAVDELHPLILLPATRRGPAETLRMTPAELRPLVALQLGAMHPREHLPQLEASCRRAREEGVPVALHIRTWKPVESEADYDGKVMPPEVLRNLVERFDNVVAVIVAEQYAFTREQRDYLRRVLAICDEFGVHCIYDAGWHGGADWNDILLYPETRQAVERHRRVFVPMWEMNISYGMLHEHAQSMGLWLAGSVERWGANPQSWLWGEAGFGSLGEEHGWRYGSAGGMAAGLAAREHYPFYAHSLLFTALTGAQVFWVGGELPPHAWDEQGRPSRFWRDAIEPALLALVGERLIPSRESMQARVRAWITNRQGWPYVVDDRAAHEGRRSLRLECGAGRAQRLAWATDDYVKAPAGRWQLAGWVKTEGVAAPAVLDLTWFDGPGWHHAPVRGPVNDRRWRELRRMVVLPQNAAFLQVHLRCDSPSGRAWFDDVSLQRPGDSDDVLPNPGFEATYEGGRRPLGWRPAGAYGPPQSETLEKGVNRLWRRFYGLVHSAEFIPDAADPFPIVCAPRRPVGAQPCIDVADLETAAGQSLFAGKPPQRGRCFLFDNGQAIWISNAHENRDEAQPFSAQWQGLSLDGELNVHHWVLVTGGRRHWRLWVGGRRGRMTRFTLCGRQPLPEPVALRGRVHTRRRDGRTWFVEIDHGADPVALLELGG